MHSGNWPKHWIRSDVIQQEHERDELFQLGFDWEVNNGERGQETDEIKLPDWETNQYSYIPPLPINASCHYGEYVPDMCEYMIYTTDYFIERDLVF